MQKLDSANLSKIENGKSEFDEKRLDKLANAFELDIEKLKVEYFSDQSLYVFKPGTYIVKIKENDVTNLVNEYENLTTEGSKNTSGTL